MYVVYQNGLPIKINYEKTSLLAGFDNLPAGAIVMMAPNETVNKD